MVLPYAHTLQTVLALINLFAPPIPLQGTERQRENQQPDVMHGIPNSVIILIIMAGGNEEISTYQLAWLHFLKEKVN